ncbi:MAG: oligosaccharide flippase family protein [bacterium]|nr:oligosaccharide flippase family protein [bacterium]
MASRKRNYTLSVVTGYIVTLVGSLLGLWLTPYSLQFLSREAFGIITLSGTLILWMGLLDIGITTGFRTHMARETGKLNADDYNRYASTTYFSQLGIAAAVLALGALLAVGFPSFFEVSPELRDDAALTFMLLVVGTAANLGLHTFSAILWAHQQIHVDNLVKLLMFAVRTIAAVIFLNLGFGVMSLALGNLCAIILAGVLAVQRVYRIVPDLKLRPLFYRWSILKGIARTGLWLSLGSLAGLVIQSVDTTVAARLVSLEAVTIYALTHRLYSTLQQMLDPLINNARPGLGQLMGQGKLDQALRTYQRLVRISVGVCVVGALTLWAVNRTFMLAWVGAENYGGIWLDLAFALNLIANTWNLPNRAVLTANLQVRQQTLARLVEAALNLTLSILLTLQFGLIGVVISTTLAAISTTSLYLPYLTAKMFNRPFWRFLAAESTPQLLLLAAMFPLSFVARWAAESIGGYPGVVIGAAVGGLLGLAAMWIISFDADLRAQFTQLAGQVFSRVRRTVTRSA